MSEINRPDVVAELTERYLLYEKALIDNDIEVMTQLFWDSPHVVRFGIAENLYGSEEIKAFRKARPTAANLDREMARLQVITFGDDTGSVTLEFRRPVAGVVRLGRQSQVWRKMAGGWRIVSAHVSFLPTA